MRRARTPVDAALVAALALLLGGCELTSVEVARPEDVVVVEAYLRTDVSSQEVYLYRTLPGPDNTLRVVNASIRVRDDLGQVLEYVPAAGDLACARYSALPEGQAGSCYVTDPTLSFVRPGRRYTLEVTLPDGRRITGATTVPGAFQLVRPGPPQCLLESTAYDFIWTRSEGAWAYQAVASFTGLAEGLRARGVEDPPDELDLLGLAVGGADTTIAFPSEFGVFDRFSLDRDLLLALQEGLPAGARADVVVAAGDRNYVNWVRGGNFNPSGQVRVPSVTGDGTGVFGSLVVQQRLLLTEQDPDVQVPSCE